MYQLDLATLLMLLAEQTGHLSTTAVLLVDREAPCEVMMTLQAGQVQQCRVIHAGQVVLTEEDALQAIQRAGVLSWTYTPHLSHPPDLPPMFIAACASDLAPLVPQRTRLVSVSELAHWPLRQRTIYHLSDGTRSLETIAHLLCQSLEGLAALIVQMQQHRVLRLAVPGERRDPPTRLVGNSLPSADWEQERQTVLPTMNPLERIVSSHA